jgi:hypothetical protein
MIRLMFSLVPANAIAVTATTAMARSRHNGAPLSETYFYNPTNDPDAVTSAALMPARIRIPESARHFGP